MCRNKLIFLLVLVCLLTGLAPLSDFDLDGVLDSFLSEGLIALPLVCFVSGLFSIWVRLPDAFFTVSQRFLSLTEPPPIHN